MESHIAHSPDSAAVAGGSLKAAERHGPGFVPPRSVVRKLDGILVLAAVALLVCIYVEPRRGWSNLLLLSHYVASLGAIGVVLLALHYICGAGWWAVLRRPCEAIVGGLLPIGALLSVAGLFGIHALYEWSHSSALEHDAVLRDKSAYLNIGFFAARTVFSLGVWYALSRLLISNSRRQDDDGRIIYTQRNKAISAVFIVVFAITFSMFSIDWLMSLEPHWYSTIFAVYNFSGALLAGLAALTVVAIALRRMGYMRDSITEEHLHDLGKYLFSFSSFWAYIWLSQFLLIWYSNIPEETVYFTKRLEGGLGSMMGMVVLLNWIVPFFALLPRAMKRNESVLWVVAFVILAGRWLDLALMIFPAALGEAFPLSGWELLFAAGLFALCARVIFLALAKSNLIPVGDPMLQESLHHHQTY